MADWVPIDDPNDPRLANTPLNEPAASAPQAPTIDFQPAAPASAGPEIQFQPAADQATGPRGGDHRDLVTQSLLDHGVKPVAAAAILGDIQQESGFDPHNVSDHGSSFGLLQVGGPMFRQFNADQAAQGIQPGDPAYVYNQAPFVINKFAQQHPDRFAAMQNAPDAPTALKIFRSTPDWGYGIAGKRYQYAQNYQQALSGVPVQQVDTYTRVEKAVPVNEVEHQVARALPVNGARPPLPATDTLNAPPAPADQIAFTPATAAQQPQDGINFTPAQDVLAGQGAQRASDLVNAPPTQIAPTDTGELPPQPAQPDWTTGVGHVGGPMDLPEPPDSKQFQGPFTSRAVQTGVRQAVETGLSYAPPILAARTLLPEDSKIRQGAEAVIKGGGALAEGLAEPENLAIIAATEGLGLPEVGGKIISGYFAAQMASQLPEQWQAFKAAPDFKSKVQIATQALGTMVFAGLAGAHTISEAPIPGAVGPTRFDKTDAGLPAAAPPAAPTIDLSGRTDQGAPIPADFSEIKVPGAQPLPSETARVAPEAPAAEPVAAGAPVGQLAPREIQNIATAERNLKSGQLTPAEYDATVVANLGPERAKAWPTGEEVLNPPTAGAPEAPPPAAPVEAAVPAAGPEPAGGTPATTAAPPAEEPAPAQESPAGQQVSFDFPGSKGTQTFTGTLKDVLPNGDLRVSVPGVGGFRSQLFHVDPEKARFVEPPEESAATGLTAAPATVEPAAPTLPRDLAGAKPRYSYGQKQFDLKFASDVDRAAYIAAQSKPSKADARYVQFVKDATGMSDAEVRSRGRDIRAAIKDQARGADPGTLDVPMQEPALRSNGQKLKLKANRNNGGFINPEVMRDVLDFGRQVYGKGMDYAKWAGEMVRHLGSKIAEHLRNIWEQITDRTLPPARESGAIGRTGLSGRARVAPGPIESGLQQRAVMENVAGDNVQRRKTGGESRGVRNEDQTLISTRRPSAVNAPEDPNQTGDNRLHIGVERMPQPEMKEFQSKVAAKLRPWMPKEIRSRNDGQQIENAINFFKENKTLLHRLAEQQPWLERAMRQYEGYNIHGHNLVDQYGFTPEGVFGAETVMSSGKSPDASFSMAERLMRTMRQGGDVRWDARFDKTVKSGGAEGKGIPIKGRDLSEIRGKTFNELTTHMQKARWARVYDQTFHSPEYPVITPEGTRGPLESTKTGTATLTWTSFPEIAKALRLLDGTSHPNEVIETAKHSNYYNSKRAPGSHTPDYVADRHDVSGSYLMPLGSHPTIPLKAHPLLTDHFSGLYNARTGDYGIYALHAEAGRRAAAELGLTPSDFQAGHWSYQRGFMSPRVLGDKASRQIQDVWKDTYSGKRTIEQARAETLRIANDALADKIRKTGYDPTPAWAREPQGSTGAGAAVQGAAGQPEELPGARGLAGTAGPGGRGGAAPGTPEAGTLADRARNLRRETGDRGFVTTDHLQAALDFGRDVYGKGMDFARWSGEMIRHLGDKIKEHLGNIWRAVTGREEPPFLQRTLRGSESGAIGESGLSGKGGDEPPTKPDVWYNRQTRAWVSRTVDAEGNQIGESYYTGSKRDALSQAFVGKDDKFWGIEDAEDGARFKESGHSAVECTGYACAIQKMLGKDRVKVYGFFGKDNPGSEIARSAGGHDFAVVDGRYIVDPWVKDVEGLSKLGVFDMQSDGPEIARLYGDRKAWEILPDQTKFSARAEPTTGLPSREEIGTPGSGKILDEPPSQADLEDAANDPEKMRGHIATIKRMTEVSPDVKAQVESWYEPTTLDAVNNAANETINKLGLGKATDAFMGSTKADAGTMALGHNLALRLDEQQHYEDAAMVRDKMAEKLTTPAQSLWYISTIGKTSPEGLIRTAQDLVTQLIKPEDKPLLDQINRLRAEISKLKDKGARDAATKIVIQQAARVNKPGQRLTAAQVDELLQKHAAGNLDENQLAQNLARYFKIPRLTPENITKIKAAQKAWSDVPDSNPILKQVRAADMMDTVYGLVPRSFWDKVRAASVISMIMHGKLPLRIGASSALRLAGQTVVDGIQNFLPDMGNIFSGRATRTGGQVRGIIEGMVDPLRAYRAGYTDAKIRGLATAPSFKEGMHALLTRAQLVNRGFTDAAAVQGGMFTFSSRFGRLFENTVGLLHNVMPLAFYDAAYRSSLYRQMRAARVGVPDADMVFNAHLDANKVISNNPTMLYKFASEIRKGLDLPTAMVTKGKYGLGTALLPFALKPASLLSEGLTWTPLGLGKATAELLRPVFNKGEPIRPKEVGDALVKAALGTGVLVGAGYQLAKIGVLTGAPDDNKDLEAMRKASGWGAYKINVSELKRRAMSWDWHTRSQTPADGDYIVNYNWLEPVAFPVAAGADLAQSETKRMVDLKRGKILPAAVLSAAGAGVQSLVDSPMLQGVQQFSQAVGEGQWGRAVVGLLANVPGNFVPALVRQTSQYMDNTVRETRGTFSGPVSGGITVDREASNILTQIPGLEQRYPAKYDVFGNAIERYNYGNNSLFNVFFNPAMVSKFETNPQLAEMQRLYEATGATKGELRQVPATLTVNGKQVELTNEQVATYQRYVGKEASAVVTRLLASPQFAAEPMGTKQAVIANVLGAVNNAAKMDLFGQSPVTVGMGMKGPTLSQPSVMDIAALIAGRKQGLKQSVMTPGPVAPQLPPLWRLAPPPALPSRAP